MREVSLTISDCANSGAEARFGESDLAVRALSAVMRKLHDRFKREKAKPIAHIAVRARVGTRAVEEWWGGGSNMSGKALASLILSDVGDDVIDALIKSVSAKERPMWARRYLNTLQLAAIEQRAAEQDEEIKQLRLSLLK